MYNRSKMLISTFHNNLFRNVKFTPNDLTATNCIAYNYKICKNFKMNQTMYTVLNQCQNRPVSMPTNAIKTAEQSNSMDFLKIAVSNFVIVSNVVCASKIRH